MDQLLRLHRYRKNAAMRALLAETHLQKSDLILPLFICEGNKERQIIPAMEEVFRLSVDLAIEVIKQAKDLGIVAFALFPVVEQAKKSLDAKEAFAQNGLIQRAVHTIKNQVKDVLIITDVALDPFTLNGQDGLCDQKGAILNDETVAILCKQALSHAQAGADIVAPSDMMDGRVLAIRQTLEQKGFKKTAILSYCAKYASHFYSPFRDAVGSGQNLTGDKKTYQMDFRNSTQALLEKQLDEKEGADFLMVKPATFYLDVIARMKQKSYLPIFAYQVSGEYVMLRTFAKAQKMDYMPLVLENLIGIKRAGTQAIFSYFALDVAKVL